MFRTLAKAKENGHKFWFMYLSRLFTIPAAPRDGGRWRSKCGENGLASFKSPFFLLFSPFIGKDANHSRRFSCVFPTLFSLLFFPSVSDCVYIRVYVICLLSFVQITTWFIFSQQLPAPAAYSYIFSALTTLLFPFYGNKRLPVKRSLKAKWKKDYKGFEKKYFVVIIILAHTVLALLHLSSSFVCTHLRLDGQLQLFYDTILHPLSPQQLFFVYKPVYSLHTRLLNFFFLFDPTRIECN